MLHVDRSGTDPETRKAVVERFRQALTDGRQAIVARFLEDSEGLACAKNLARLEDELIRAIRAYVVRHVYPLEKPTSSERLGIVAVGGYGRFTLAPGSDIDLLFLLPYKQTPWGESVVEAMLYMLWDLQARRSATPPARSTSASARRKRRHDDPHLDHRGALHRRRPRAVRRAA